MIYASFWKRAAAYLVDYFISSFIALIVGFVLGYVLAQMGVSNAVSRLVTVLLGLGVFIGYYVWPESSAWQATIGKRIFGLKVTDENGQRISFWRSLGRYLGFIVSGLALGIGYLMCLWTERKQCLHDKLANCLVVDIKPDEKQGCVIGLVSGFFMLFVLLIVGVLLTIVSHPFERTLGNMAAKNLEAARRVQNAYYKEHNQYATRWNQLNFVEECNNEASNRCALTRLFTFELEPEGVAAQREDPRFSYRLFRAYDLNDTRRNLVCISKDERVKAFCRGLVERQAVSAPQPQR